MPHLPDISARSDETDRDASERPGRTMRLGPDGQPTAGRNDAGDSHDLPADDLPAHDLPVYDDDPDLISEGSAAARLEALIGDLADEPTPVERMSTPALRATSWLAIVGALTITLAVFADLEELFGRMVDMPEFALALAASVVTMGLAALAAFELSVPDRSPTWALVPLPSAAIWIGASIAGFVRVWMAPDDAYDPTLSEVRDCLVLILALALPLSALMVFMLRRAYSLWPRLAAATAGLAAVSAGLTLFNLFRPWDAAAADLFVNLIAVTAVIGCSVAFGAPALTRTLRRPAKKSPRS